MQMKLLDLPDLDWIALLRAEVEKGRTKADVAREIGMPRPSLSLLLSGNYPAKLDKKTKRYAQAVVARYARGVFCPHLRVALTVEACRSHASAPMSTSDPAKLRHWAACRACPGNPLTAPEVKDAV